VREEVSVISTEILAGIVSSQCFSNVLQVHESSPCSMKIELTSGMLAASEIYVADSRGGLFSAFVGDQGC
jgi:hypothetical protein